MSHERDFGIPATLEFFPTAHGKGNCDRLAAVVKQTVRRDSLRKKKGYQPILNPFEMYQHLIQRNTIEERKYIYVSKEQVKENYLSLLKLDLNKEEQCMEPGIFTLLHLYQTTQLLYDDTQCKKKGVSLNSTHYKIRTFISMISL